MLLASSKYIPFMKKKKKSQIVQFGKHTAWKVKWETF